MKNNTPLHLSAFTKQVHVFKFFIEQLGFDPNMKGMQGWRPLHMASASGDLELIRYLIEDLNCSPSIDEESPLVIAERNRNDDVIMYFIEKCPWIFNKFSEISSTMQDLSINRSTKPSESDMSNILYEVSQSSETEATSHPCITQEKHSVDPTFRERLHKYAQN